MLHISALISQPDCVGRDISNELVPSKVDLKYGK